MYIALSWVCWMIGHAVSLTIEPILGHWFEWPYRLYNTFMVWSSDLQGDSTSGPWEEPHV